MYHLSHAIESGMGSVVYSVEKAGSCARDESNRKGDVRRLCSPMWRDARCGKYIGSLGGTDPFSYHLRHFWKSAYGPVLFTPSLKKLQGLSRMAPRAPFLNYIFWIVIIYTVDITTPNPQIVPKNIDMSTSFTKRIHCLNQTNHHT
jgi:hypothetical protein